MTAIFKPEGQQFRAMEHAGGPWSPDMLQGSATTALMTRDIDRLATESGFAVRRLTFDLWRPAGLRVFQTTTELLRDGRGQDRPGAADGRRDRDRPLHGALDGAERRIARRSLHQARDYRQDA